MPWSPRSLAGEPLPASLEDTSRSTDQPGRSALWRATRELLGTCQPVHCRSECSSSSAFRRRADRSWTGEGTGWQSASGQAGGAFLYVYSDLTGLATDRPEGHPVESSIYSMQ